MRQVKSLAIVLVAFAAGLVVGGWKPEIARALKVRLGLPDRTFDIQNPSYRSRLDFFRQTVGDADVIMLGDSITSGTDWHELFPGVRILNRGISGDTSAGVFSRLDEVIGRRPKIVFLMIGINDLQSGVPVSMINANIRSIVGALEQKQIRVVLQKTLYATSAFRPQINDRVSELNNSLSNLCSTSRVSCLDLNQVLGVGGALSPSFSLDGLHLNTAAYFAWKKEISALFPP